MEIIPVDSQVVEKEKPKLAPERWPVEVKDEFNNMPESFQRWFLNDGVDADELVSRKEFNDFVFRNEQRTGGLWSKFADAIWDNKTDADSPRSVLIDPKKEGVDFEGKISYMMGEVFLNPLIRNEVRGLILREPTPENIDKFKIFVGQFSDTLVKMAEVGFGESGANSSLGNVEKSRLLSKYKPLDDEMYSLEAKEKELRAIREKKKGDGKKREIDLELGVIFKKKRELGEKMYGIVESERFPIQDQILNLNRASHKYGFLSESGAMSYQEFSDYLNSYKADIAGDIWFLSHAISMAADRNRALDIVSRSFDREIEQELSRLTFQKARAVRSGDKDIEEYLEAGIKRQGEVIVPLKDAVTEGLMPLFDWVVNGDIDKDEKIGLLIGRFNTGVDQLNRYPEWDARQRDGTVADLLATLRFVETKYNQKRKL